MDLLRDEMEKKPQSKGKKLVLILLIISVILLIAVIVLLQFLSNKAISNRKYTLAINGQIVELTEGLIIADLENNKYISLEEIAKYMGYIYYNSEYLGVTENKEKCYLDNENEIIGLEANTNKIFKTTANSGIDYQYYTISKNVILNNNKLYVYIEDLKTICNSYVSYSEKDVQTQIYTADVLAKQYNDKEKKTYTSVSSDYNNKKAIVYNMIVVETEGKYGVINSSLESVIGSKYPSMIFDEYTQSFIVSGTNGKYGVIDKAGSGKIYMDYDSLRIISYSPLLYEVEQNDKFGILDEKGNIIINLDYEAIGYKGDTKNNINPLLIVPNITSNENGLIVVKDKKYGIVSLSTGNIILDCITDRIYSKKINNQNRYFVEKDGQTYEVGQYIDYINTLTVNI